MDSNISVDPSVKLGKNVIIHENVRIMAGAIIGDNVIIHSGTTIGRNVVVGDGSILGKIPFKPKRSALTDDKFECELVIGDDVRIGVNCVIYVGSILEKSVFVGDLAVIREEVHIGEETIIGKGVTVENKTFIGKRCKIETNAYITALSTIEDYCFVAPEVTFTNDNFLGRTEERYKYFKGPTLKKGARIGANATILPGTVIGEDAVVGAGSVVTKDVPPRIIVVGAPARFLKEVPREQLLENQKFYEEGNDDEPNRKDKE